MNPRIDSTDSGRDTAISGLPTIDVAMLEQLFDQAPDVAFFVKDADGRYVAVNQSLVERHGLLSKSQVIGKRPSDIGRGDFGRIPSEQDRQVLETGQPIVDHLEMQWRRPEQPVWCLTTKLANRNSNDEIVGLIGFSRDVRVAVDPDEIPASFANAMEEFEKELAPEVTPAWLAERAGIRLQRLARLTKRLHGLTPSQWIAKTRLAAASRMLRDTDSSISNIALAVGFYDHSAFTRAFRSATGLTPSEFRKR